MNELYQTAYEECGYGVGGTTGSTGGSSSIPRVFVRKRLSSTTWTAWQEIWHSGNMGANSGLNADLVDGKHASAFLEVASTKPVPRTGDVVVIGRSADGSQHTVYPSSVVATSGGVFDVKDYTTDLDAVIAAITALPSTGGILTLAGNFSFTNTNITRSGQYYNGIIVNKPLIVDGTYATITCPTTLKAEYANYNLFYIFKVAAGCTKFVLRNVKADIPTDMPTTSPYTVPYLVYLNYSDTIKELVIDSCNITSKNGTLYLSSGHNNTSVTIRDCSIEADPSKLGSVVQIYSRRFLITGNRIKGFAGISADAVTNGLIEGNIFEVGRMGMSLSSLISPNRVKISSNQIICTGEGLSTYDPASSSNYSFYTVGIGFNIGYGYSYGSWFTATGITIVDNTIETWDLGIDFTYRMKLVNGIIKNNIIRHARPTANALPIYADIEQTKFLRSEMTAGIWLSRAENSEIDGNICYIGVDTTNLPSGYPSYIGSIEDSKVNAGSHAKYRIIDVMYTADVNQTNPVNLPEISDCSDEGLYTIVRRLKIESGNPVSVAQTDRTYKVLCIKLASGDYNKNGRNTTLYNGQTVYLGSLEQFRTIQQYVFIAGQIYSRVVDYILVQNTIDIQGTIVATNPYWQIDIDYGWTRFYNEDDNGTFNAEYLNSRNSGNSSGNIPINNGTVNTNLNADKLDGLEGANLARTDANALSSRPTVSGVYTFYTAEITGSSAYYGLTVIYYNGSNYSYFAVSFTTGKLYRYTSGVQSWNEITTKIPVLTTSPSSPSDGDMWII